MSAVDVRRAHAASWADVVDAAAENFSLGYDLGLAHGRQAAEQDAQDAARQAYAARTAQDHLQVHQARQRAAARWGA